MQMRALGLVMLVALFVVVGTPQAQPLATDPVIPMPIIQDNGPGTETTLASAAVNGDQVSTPVATADSIQPAPTAPSQTNPDKLGRFGTIKLPSTAFEVCYLFYMEDAKPSALVLWRAIGEGTKFDVREVRERISLQASQSQTLKGVYTLQTDYHVQKLNLSTQDTAHIFDLLQSDSDGKVLLGDATWKGKVHSSLKEVEYDPERSKEIKKLAAQRAREAKRAAKVATQQRVPATKSNSPAKTKASKAIPAHTTAAAAGKAMARR